MDRGAEHRCRARVRKALEGRAATGWYGYETRPPAIIDAFWEWMQSRHGWDRAGLYAAVSPSVGTSIGVLIEQLTDPGDGVVIQPPVFTDFTTIIADNARTVVRNPLVLTESGYESTSTDSPRTRRIRPPGS